MKHPLKTITALNIHPSPIKVGNACNFYASQMSTSLVNSRFSIGFVSIAWPMQNILCLPSIA